MIMIRQIHPVVGLVLVIQERQAVKTNYCNCKTCWDLSSSHPFHPKFGKRKAICKINLQNMAEHDFNDVQKLVRSQLVVNPNYSGERGWNIFRTSTAEIFFAIDIMTYFLFSPRTTIPSSSSGASLQTSTQVTWLYRNISDSKHYL